VDHKDIQKPKLIGWSFLLGIILSLIAPFPTNAGDHGGDCGSATSVDANRYTTGIVETAGDYDYFRVTIPTSGQLIIYTEGSTDTYGYLKDSSCMRIIEDNDRGEGRNFLISQPVNAGTYYIAVKGYSSYTGSYILHTLYGHDLGWQDMGLYGGQMQAIAIDPVEPNTLFAGSGKGDGLFKSTNGGETWQTVAGFRNQSILDISFDPADHRTIWVATFWYVYKSEDGGSTWIRFDPGRQDGYSYYWSLAIDPSDSNTVYVGTAGYDASDDYARVYKTTDGGATWQATSLIADHNVVGFAINPQNTQEIWAVTGPIWVTEGSIYRSQDGGASWSEINTGFEPGWFYSVVINPQNPSIVYVGGENGLYRTRDGGESWSQLEPNYGCRGLALAPGNPNTVYAGWIENSAAISKSTDGGDTWVTYRIAPLESVCLTVHPQNSQVLYGGDVNEGVYKSTDGGATWHTINQGIKANHVFASAVSPGGKHLVGSMVGIYLKNRGESWEKINHLKAHAVAFSPADENTIYAGFDLDLGKSTDAGQTWSYTDISSSSSPHRVSSISINPQNPNTLYLGVHFLAGNRGEIYKSTDGGNSIRLLFSADVPVDAVTVNPMNPQVVYAGTGMFYAPAAPGAVYKSIDGGETWERMGTGVTVNALVFDPENPEVVYAGCGASDNSYSGLFKSTDGGITWEEKDFGIRYGSITDIAVDPENSNILYAASYYHGVYRSYNSGDNWTLVGLSGYHLFDVLVPASNANASLERTIRASESTSSSDLYAGSGSGILEFTGAGLGIITGMVTDAKTGLGITGATIFTNTGGVSLSLDGYYVLLVPTGICQVKAKADGCLGKKELNVDVTLEGERTVDFRLSPLPATLSIKKFDTDATGPVPVGTRVTFTAEAESLGGATLYYRFLASPGYGSPNYPSWRVIQEYSTDNTCTFTPDAEGTYIIVAWVTDDATSGKFQQVGIALSTTQASSSPVQIMELESDISYPLNAGDQITLAADATGGSGARKYQFWVTDGTNWQTIQRYSATKTCTWTANEAGCYIIVVWASDTEATQSPPLAGWTCVVE